MPLSSFSSSTQIFAKNVNTKTAKAAKYLKVLDAIVATRATLSSKATVNNAHHKMMPAWNARTILFASSVSLDTL